MEILLGIIPTLILGFLLWQEKRDRALERKERDLKEVALLNRIQAPEVEVAKVFAPEDDEPAYVGFEDDDAFNDYKRGVSGEPV